MSNLLYQIERNRIRARTIFKASLKIYEDYIVFRRRRWFMEKETTITYKQIAQVNISKGVFFSTLHVISSGGFEETEIGHVFNKEAMKAKRIIEQKLHRSHAPSRQRGDFKRPKEHKVDKLEKSLNRLKELVNKGKISEKEYEKRRKRMLESID